MRVLGNPLLHLDSKPEGVYAQRDNAEKLPYDELHKKITACTVEVGLLAVNDGMVSDPFLPDADAPGRAQTECDCAQKDHEDPCADKPGQTAGEL